MVILLLFIFYAIYTFLKSGREEAERNTFDHQFFKVHKFDFGGQVYSKVPFEHGAGLFFLNLLHSDPAYYNPFKAGDPYFFCSIRNQKGAVYTDGLSFINIKDSVYVSSEKDSIYIYRQGVLVDSRRMGLCHYDEYNRKIEGLVTPVQ